MADKKQLKSYVDSMIQAADIVKRENPDYLVAPMLGSVPLIDGMATASNDFDPSKVVYMPASSRVENVNEVIRNWYSNFLNGVVNATWGVYPKIMGIDEVVSGQSVMRCMNIIDIVVGRKKREIEQLWIDKVHSREKDESIRALGEIDSLTNNQYALEFSKIRNQVLAGIYFEDRELLKKDSQFVVGVLRQALESELIYRTIGIEDSKKQGSRNNVYEQRKSEGRIFPVSVDTILTMDDPRFCPAKFKELHPESSKEHVLFSPHIQNFEVSPEYINFLKDIANYVGKNPNEVHPVNMVAILDSAKYL